MDHSCKLSPSTFEAAWKMVATTCDSASRDYTKVIDTVSDGPLKDWARTRLAAIQTVASSLHSASARAHAEEIVRHVLKIASMESSKAGYRPLPVCTGDRQFALWNADVPVRTQAHAIATLLYRSGLAVANAGYAPGTAEAEAATIDAVLASLRDDAPLGPVPALMGELSGAAVLASSRSGIYLATCKVVEDGRYGYAMKGESWCPDDSGGWQQEDEWKSACYGDPFEFLEETAPLARPEGFAVPTCCAKVPRQLAMEAVWTDREQGYRAIARLVDYLPRDEFPDPLAAAPWGCEAEVRRAAADLAREPPAPAPSTTVSRRDSPSLDL